MHSVKYFANHRFGYVTSDLAGETTFPDAWQGVAPHAAAGLVNANPVYWPVDGTLSFFCYAPYREGDADIVLEDPVSDAGVAARLPDYLPGSPLIRVTPPETAASQFDFLASPALLDRSRHDDAGRFPLDFSRHRMTQVEFWFAYKGTLQNDPSQDPRCRRIQVLLFHGSPRPHAGLRLERGRLARGSCGCRGGAPEGHLPPGQCHRRRIEDRP